jgi:hypothetical protein
MGIDNDVSDSGTIETADKTRAKIAGKSEWRNVD